MSGVFVGAKKEGGRSGESVEFELMYGLGKVSFTGGPVFLGARRCQA